MSITLQTDPEYWEYIKELSEIVTLTKKDVAQVENETERFQCS